MAAVNERFWKLLLPLVEARQVIPVIGRDLLRVDVQGKEALFYDWLALQLAEQLGVAIGGAEPTPRLHDVACRFLDQRGLIDEIYIAINDIIERQPLPDPPGVLLKLARVSAFRLFVSITFDAFLEQALNQVRGAGRAKVHSLAYSLNGDFDDLPVELGDLDRPAVYRLLGRVSAIKQSYVVTDEDVLEFLHALQRSDCRPKRLFDALTEGQLLLIGNGFSGWLSKFFLRTLNKERLWQLRDKVGFVIDPSAGQDTELQGFLDRFGYRMLRYSGSPEEFVDELWERWQKTHPAAATDGFDEPPPPPAEGRMPRHAVFLSYASEDRDVVGRIQQKLDADGIDAWFDRLELGAGVDWKEAIRSSVEQASAFVPIISRSVLQPHLREFRAEWEIALEVRKRLTRQPSGAPAMFIFPIVIDDTDMQAEGVRGYFGDLQAQSCPGGELPQDFRGTMKALFRQAQKTGAGVP
jgi:hypothetical protein